VTRIALGIEYDGAEYSGWQRQAHARSVQAALEGAISAVACHPVEVAAAGRTDGGVHALGQVVHFDTAAKRPDRAWLRGVNSHPAHPDIRWQVGINAPHPGPIRALGLRVKMHHLGTGMDTRISPPGSGDPHRMTGNLRQGRLQLGLHGDCMRLGLPAPIGAAIVFHTQSDARHG